MIEKFENRDKQSVNQEIASQMYAVLDSINPENQQKEYENFNEAANEFTNGVYDKGQRILEKGGFWQDSVRQAAVQANQAENIEKMGTDFAPVDFSVTTEIINGYARNLEKSGDRSDKKQSFKIDDIVRGMDKPGLAGIDGIDECIKYIESLLQTKAQSVRKMTAETKKDWEEKRAIRDALFLEKQRRVQKMQETANKERPSSMSEKEIEQIQTRDQEELAMIRNSLGLDELKESTDAEKLPSDERGLFRYFKDNFSELEVMTLLEFSRKFDGGTEQKFKEWIGAHIDSLIKSRPEDGKYRDTVASVYGNEPGMLQRIMAIKDGGKITDMNTLLSMKFSEVAKKYLDINLPKDYFNNFG